jgi:phosphoglycolate phosphatase-like HAD superfamily hydrolase
MIVFDLDGTLRNNAGSDHTVPDDKTSAENWVEWQQWVNANGKPIPTAVKLYKHFCISVIYVVTNSQFGTRQWMADHGLFADEIIERSYDDHRHPHQFKRDWIDQNRDEIELWVDDDPVILAYVETLGIPTIHITDKMRGE